ncbi:MAG: DNA gyrase subunit A [Bacteroidales bacterium]|nr:DNA gyrase subunit A [Bacteroidales bacterium]
MADITDDNLLEEGFAESDRIIKVNIEDEMRSSYIDYSMSVIVSRALPDVRDGFKPVHRRILYGMRELGLSHNKPPRKCARIVGDVLGKYHPHGDSSVYMALVRMAQEWSMRCPTVIGQGNFGSIDGDAPAAMRYTEAKLSPIGEFMMYDLEKQTVDMTENFDNSTKEPTVLPTRIPNLLVNGANGIAVGMATNVPTHNLAEVIDGCIAYMDNTEITVDELMHHIKSPDFPTGGYLLGTSGARQAYETGRGRVVIRAKTNIEVEGQHERIVVTELPYGVNRAELITHIVQLAKEGRVDGIANANDESGREGMRVVVDLKRDANANVVLNKLFKMTALQTSFSVNTIALVKGRPMTLTLKDCLKYFIEHRNDVVVRRTQYDLGKARDRAHIIDALVIACDHIDEVISIIRGSKTPSDAVNALMERFGFDTIQAQAIVDMRLRQLTNTKVDELLAEQAEIAARIEYLERVLNDDTFRKQVIKDELMEVKEKYGDVRRSEIVPYGEDFNPEDFYANDEVVITLSREGYIKRTPLAEFRAQARGGVGSKGGSTRDKDFIESIYTATMHNTMLFFTAKGRCYWLKVYELPEGAKNAKGRAIQNLLNIEPGDSISACLHIKKLNDADFCQSHYVVFCTKQGVIKKTRLADYSRPRANGVIAININEGDDVISVELTNGENELIVANREGRAVRFNENTVRVMGRGATGVKAMTLDTEVGDEVVGMVCVNDPSTETIMVVSEQGYGKRSSVEDYRITNRGTKGVKTLNITEKTGKVVAIKIVTEEHDLMIINQSGIAIRLKMEDVRVMGRATQGVRLINLGKRNDVIASVCRVNTENEEELEAAESTDATSNDTSLDTSVDNTTELNN